jgi:hypothetical protein
MQRVIACLWASGPGHEEVGSRTRGNSVPGHRTSVLFLIVLYMVYLQNDRAHTSERAAQSTPLCRTVHLWGRQLLGGGGDGGGPARRPDAAAWACPVQPPTRSLHGRICRVAPAARPCATPKRAMPPPCPPPAAAGATQRGCPLEASWSVPEGAARPPRSLPAPPPPSVPAGAWPPGTWPPAPCEPGKGRCGLAPRAVRRPPSPEGCCLVPPANECGAGAGAGAGRSAARGRTLLPPSPPQPPAPPPPPPSPPAQPVMARPRR